MNRRQFLYAGTGVVAVAPALLERSRSTNAIASVVAADSRLIVRYEGLCGLVFHQKEGKPSGLTAALIRHDITNQLSLPPHVASIRIRRDAIDGHPEVLPDGADKEQAFWSLRGRDVRIEPATPTPFSVNDAGFDLAAACGDPTGDDWDNAKHIPTATKLAPAGPLRADWDQAASVQGLVRVTSGAFEPTELPEVTGEAPRGTYELIPLAGGGPAKATRRYLKSVSRQLIVTDKATLTFYELGTARRLGAVRVNVAGVTEIQVNNLPVPLHEPKATEPVKDVAAYYYLLKTPPPPTEQYVPGKPSPSCDGTPIKKRTDICGCCPQFRFTV